MRTEASGRYEKELDPANTMPALKRALELVQLLDAGDVVNGIVDCDYSAKEPVTLPFDPDWVNRFIGIDLSAQQMIDILEKIEFKVTDGKIIVPSFRNDIEHQADISEEIARFYGYQNIPNRELSGVANGKLTPKQKFFRTAENAMLACGLSEVMTYSFFSTKAYDKICLPADSPLRNSVVISNPLGEDSSIMRTTALPSVLEVLSRNYNNITFLRRFMRLQQNTFLRVRSSFRLSAKRRLSEYTAMTRIITPSKERLKSCWQS